MLVENATNTEAQVQFIPYSGIVNPEHMKQSNFVPIVDEEDHDDFESYGLEKLFTETFLRKSKDFQATEQTNSLPIEIRLGTVYTYQNRRQEKQHPRKLRFQRISAHSLRNEEHRARHEKHFLITFNKNKGINDIQTFEHGLTCAGFRQIDDQQTTHRLYLRYQTRRLILELKRETTDQRFFSVKRLLKYSSKYTHIDVVTSKQNSSYPDAFDDIYDIRTSIGKADEEELHINDEYCHFLQIKDLERCVFESTSSSGELVYQFSRSLLRYFDFFQVKQTNIYEYSCMDSQFFGVKVLIENQNGYDLSSSSKTTTPCLQTENVVMAKFLSLDFTEADEAKRVWTVGRWLSDLAARCTNRNLPANKIISRPPNQPANYRRTVR